LDIYLDRNLRIIKVKLKSLFQKKTILFFLFISVINYISFSQNTLVFDTLGISLNIKPYDTISLTHDIIINNNNNWGIFEGEGGIVTLYDENKNLLCQQFLNPKGEWYFKDSVELFATLKFSTFSKKGKIKLTNNPGDGSEEEAGKKISFEIPISFNSPDYYGEIHHEGLVEEGGNDIVIYYLDGMVKAHLRNYSNSYDNSYIDLFGKGEKGDSQLNLNSIIFSEGECYEGGDFKLNFNNDILKVDRLPNITLNKKTKMISGLKWMGNMPKSSEIKTTFK
jgi:hypothetical protein